jgi:hypothetical protein
MSTTEQAGRPGKYQRSAPGLVVAMVTTVVAVGAVLWFMGLFRHSTDIKPQRVDYRQAVAAMQQAKKAVVYPATLPAGYIATQARVPDDGDGFEVDLLKGDKDFIGIRTARAKVIAALVHDDVDANATGAPAYDVPASVASPVARRWSGYRDTHGDTGYAAKVGKLNVLVYGSAPAGDLQQVVDLLTTRHLRLK